MWLWSQPQKALTLMYVHLSGFGHRRRKRTPECSIISRVGWWPPKHISPGAVLKRGRCKPNLRLTLIFPPENYVHMNTNRNPSHKIKSDSSPHIPLPTLPSPLEATSVLTQSFASRSLNVFRLSNKLAIAPSTALLCPLCHIRNFKMIIERKRTSGKIEITKERS